MRLGSLHRGTVQIRQPKETLGQLAASRYHAGKNFRNRTQPGVSAACRSGKHVVCYKLNCTCTKCNHPKVGEL